MRVFTVAWDSAQKKFIARNDLCEPIGVTDDRANAIGIAIRSLCDWLPAHTARRTSAGS